jgi:hypothetical protein
MMRVTIEYDFIPVVAAIDLAAAVFVASLGFIAVVAHAVSDFGQMGFSDRLLLQLPEPMPTTGVCLGQKSIV